MNWSVSLSDTSILVGEVASMDAFPPPDTRRLYVLGENRINERLHALYEPSLWLRAQKKMGFAVLYMT